MTTNTTTKLALSLVVPLLAFATGCSEKSDSGMTSAAEPTYRDTTNSLSSAYRDTTNSASSAYHSTTNVVAHDADNTARNAHDRTNSTLTPLDQGNNEADLRITQQIRQAVVSETNNYSMLAKNVKIITAGGKVTLRGPVQTAGEKSGIAAIAKNVAGVSSVDDQLEVKANP